MFTTRRLFVGLVAILMACVGWWAYAVWDGARRAADDSAQRALIDEAVKFLDAYHDQNGEYPKSLDVFTFTYPDGGDSSILATLQYHSNGKTYTIVARSLQDGSEIRESRK